MYLPPVSHSLTGAILARTQLYSLRGCVWVGFVWRPSRGDYDARAGRLGPRPPARHDAAHSHTGTPATHNLPHPPRLGRPWRSGAAATTRGEQGGDRGGDRIGLHAA